MYIYKFYKLFAWAKSSQDPVSKILTQKELVVWLKV
jgi:hypothetical protein